LTVCVRVIYECEGKQGEIFGNAAQAVEMKCRKEKPMSIKFPMDAPRFSSLTFGQIIYRVTIGEFPALPDERQHLRR
jgi:hypothetical protein